MRRSLLLALALAGCSLLGPRTFTLTFPKFEDFAPLPVALTDVSGTVTAIDLQPSGPAAAPIANAVRPIEGRSNAVVLDWTGGACDEQVEVDVEVSGRTTFTLTTHHGLGGCFAVGVQRRLVVLFATPVDASTMTIETVFVPIR